jgi:hypothetical protein
MVLGANHGLLIRGDYGPSGYSIPKYVDFGSRIRREDEIDAWE